MPLPVGYISHPISGLIFQVGTDYGPFSVSTTGVITFLGVTFAGTGVTNFGRGSNGLYYKRSDNSGPYARNVTDFYNFLN
jgi:hypothetical protein